MEDFIKSAFGYFGGPSQGVKEHELVGESVEIGKTHFRIRRVIAEGMYQYIYITLGGYAVVFEGYDASQGRSFAIKVGYFYFVIFSGFLHKIRKLLVL